MVVGGGDLLKVHVHTNDPGKALQHGLSLGYLSAIKIDNMREQNANLSETPSWEEMCIRDSTNIVVCEEESSAENRGLVLRQNPGGGTYGVTENLCILYVGAYLSLIHI